MEVLTAILLVLLTIIVLWIYKVGFTRSDIFTPYGVPIAGPVYPFVGTLWGIWKEHGGEKDLVKRRKYGKIWGEYAGKSPVFVISDCDMLRDVLIKDFDAFANRGNVFGEEQKKQPILRKFLTVLENKEWKNVRSHLSPAFTSGKLKRMIPLVDECAKRLVKMFQNEAAHSEGHVAVKDKLGAYQMDVIASAAFGTKIDTVDNPDHPFVVSAKKFSSPAFSTPLLMIPFVFPWVMRLIPLFPMKEPMKVFEDTVKSIIDQRRTETEQKRGDMLDLLIETSKTAEDITEEVIIANSVIFLLAGNETVVNTICWFIYSMIVHPEIQETVYEEIVRVLEEHSGKITGEMVHDCVYLEQAIMETLRVYPTLVRGERSVERDYELNGIKIPAKTNIQFPIWAIQHDPVYFPDPEEFNPDRFSKENKGLIHPLAFLSFGAGPRNCIGMRLAIEVIQVTLIRLMLAFRFVKGNRQTYPMKPTPGIFNSAPIDFKMGVESRTSEVGHDESSGC